MRIYEEMNSFRKNRDVVRDVFDLCLDDMQRGGFDMRDLAYEVFELQQEILMLKENMKLMLEVQDYCLDQIPDDNKKKPNPHSYLKV